MKTETKMKIQVPKIKEKIYQKIQHFVAFINSKILTFDDYLIGGTISNLSIRLARQN